MSEDNGLKEQAELFKEKFFRIREEIGKAIVGQERVVEASITALVCGGGVLREGVPGLGTMGLAKQLPPFLYSQ